MTVALASGQEGMLNVFEDFVIKRSKRAAEAFGLKPLTVWKMLKEGIADSMATQGRTWLTLPEAHGIFQKFGLTGGRDSAFVKELSNEGLLFEDVIFDVSTRRATEVVRLPYQKFSDHLIARYLLKGLEKDDPAKCLAAGTPIGALLTPSANFNRYDSVVEALLIEFPERAKQAELLDFLPRVNEELARLFLNGLAWRKSSSFSKSTSKWISRLLAHEPLVRETLSALVGLATKPKHPFGAKPLDGYLRKMTLPERDLHWSEFLRHQYEESVCQRLLAWLETLEADKLTAEYAEVYIAVLRWFLTSTNRHFRDRATRGLYVVGRRFPEMLFASTLDSFSINDPYIRERMLAASYGVVMALQFGPGSEAFCASTLRPFSQRLYKTMFAKGAPHATTHILTRDYARHILEAALLHEPNLFRRNEIRRIRPPFKDGGIRRWGRSADRDKARASPGSPLHTDFLNYTLGTLVRDRGNYDFKHPGHVRVVQNIHWRIYQLGYDFGKFEKIDKEIANAYWRAEGGSKVDRYGKKYAWIAFFELAGHRADTGTSRREDPTQRTPEVDIEPSFPVAPSPVRLVRRSLLGRSQARIGDWIKRGPKPNLRPYLIRTAIGHERGRWLALDGFVEHKDLQRHRAAFAFLKSIFVRKADVPRIAELLHQCKEFGHTVDRLEETHYTFSGEVPWSDTYPYLANEEKLRLRTGKKYIERVPGKKATLADVLFFERTVSERDEKRGYVEVEREEFEEFDVEPAARCLSWESHHTDVTDSYSVPVLSREIAEMFRLSSRPQTFDLFDRTGRRASVWTDFEEENGASEHFLYCRESLIDQYLRSKNLELIWVTWGERRFFDKDPMRRLGAQQPGYVEFSSILPRRDFGA